VVLAVPVVLAELVLEPAALLLFVEADAPRPQTPKKNKRNNLGMVTW